MTRAARRSLRTELLVSLGFVTSAAVIVVEVTTLLLSGGDEGPTAGALLALWVGSTAVFALFTLHVVRRLVLRPLEELASEADSLGAGRLDAPRVYETAEITRLAARYRAMAQDLLDVQGQIVRVEKLAGIGSLAAGVAHEVRNPLGAVGTYLDVLRRRGADPEVTAAMRGAIERIERTVQSLLAYARPVPQLGAANANEAVRTSLEFLGAQGLLNAGTVTVQLADNLPLVAGDQHGLEQVVVNLVVNARQAAPGGLLVVGTEFETYGSRHHAAQRESDAPAAAPELARRDPRWGVRPRRTDVPLGTPGVLLYVADDGPGVPEEYREQVFDPFFTTKDPGEGTGLGLAIVARTVHEARGTVWVDRSREGGAVFKVFLPVAETTGQDGTTLERMHAAADR